MGLKLVRDACGLVAKTTDGRPLTGGARLVLVALAMNVLDEDDTRSGMPAGAYRQGAWKLAASLGWNYADPIQRRRLFRELQRLEDAGLIERVVAGAPGRRAEYALTFAPHKRPDV